MRKAAVILTSLIFVILIAVIGVIMFDRFKNPTPPQERSPGEVLHLPDPSFETNTSIEQVVRQPRSIRDYRDAPLILKELSQLLCGMRSGSLRRRITAPRPPKALYPRWRYM